MAHMLPMDSAFAMLTCCTLCRRPLRGRIVEPKNMPHIVVGSLGSAFQRCGGRGGPREAVAPDRGHCVLRLCSVPMAPVLRGMFLACCARRRSVMHAALLGPSCLMSMGGVCVKTPVHVRSFSALTPPCHTTI